MATLYELTGQYQYLLYLMEDPEVDPQIIEDSLEALSGDIEAKADGYAKVRLELLTQKAALKAEIDRLTNRVRAIDRNVDRLMESLQNTMIVMHTPKFKTELFSFSIQKNPPKVVIDDEDILHWKSNRLGDYIVNPAPQLDKAKIKEGLKDHNESLFLEGFAHLEQSESLRIR